MKEKMLYTFLFVAELTFTVSDTNFHLPTDTGIFLFRQSHLQYLIGLFRLCFREKSNDDNGRQIFRTILIYISQTYFCFFFPSQKNNVVLKDMLKQAQKVHALLSRSRELINLGQGQGNKACGQVSYIDLLGIIINLFYEYHLPHLVWSTNSFSTSTTSLCFIYVQLLGFQNKYILPDLYSLK